MSVPLGLLKHIPCPNGDACTSIRCLFRHAGDEDQYPSPEDSTALSQSQAGVGGHGRATGLGRGQPPATTTASAQHLGLGHDGSSSSKRAKTVHDEYDPETPPLPHISNVQAKRRGQAAQSHPPGKEGATAGGHATSSHASRPKPISPPPLKRKREEPIGGHASQGAATQVPATNAIPADTSGAAVAASASAAKKQAAPTASRRKPETLNPRYVSKAPAKHEVRLRLLKLLHQEFTRLNKALVGAKDRTDERKQFCLTDQGLIWAALDTEEHYATTKSATVYSDTIKHRIMEYKRMSIDQWIKERKEAREKTLRARHGLAASQTQAEVTPKSIVTGLPPDQEFILLTKDLLTPIDQLAKHGYVSKIPSPADIEKVRDADEVSKGWEQCERCSRRFQVFPGRREEDGALTSGGECQYHPGRLNKSAQVFSCCGESVEHSPGCEKAINHVFKTKDPKRMAALWNFAETPANSHVPVDQAVCFDCEMAYTVHGMEVVRLTVTAWPSGELLLDVLVRPLGEVIDLNSRFSGVWPKDFADAVPYSDTPTGCLPRAAGGIGNDQTGADDGEKEDAPDDRPPLPIVSSPKAARDLFYSLIRPETVLIGHALENDLNIMRMVHTRVVDTVLLFPHPRGLPYRYSLRTLAKEHMGRTIQTSMLSGHDSAEDARTAGDLVRTKIQARWADLRLQDWKIVDGEMVPVPSG